MSGSSKISGEYLLKLHAFAESCGIADAPEDMFQTYIDQTAAKRQD